MGDDFPYIVAIGSGTTAPAPSDTTLENELYRANNDDSNAVVEPSSEVGKFDYRITVQGGVEVPSGSDITEFGMLTDQGTLLYRQVGDAVELQSGDRKTFEGALSLRSS